MTPEELEKQRKKERKAEKKRKRQEEEEQQQAATAAAAAVAPADSSSDDASSAPTGESERKKAKKEAKRAARERREEVLAAGERALAEEAAELQQEERDEKARKEEKKRKKKEKKEAEAKAAAAAESSEAMDTSAGAEEETEKQKRKREKKEKKEKARKEAAAASSSSDSSASAPSSPAATSTPAPTSSSAASSTSSTTSADGSSATPAKKEYPPPPPGNITLLLFYQYVRPNWTAAQRQNAENFTRDTLAKHDCTGRLRCAREGFNGTLTGPKEGIRAFCQALREYEPQHFGNTDFKFVDGLRESQKLKGLKVWHVDELVTYGFDNRTGKIEDGGTHLPPQEWHDKAAEEDTVLIDVRNANENAIGRFQPLNDPHRVLDPNMRVSTEFPEWVEENLPKLQKAKQIMMYCTGGIRCERASALLVEKGLPSSKVFQLEGGIHRYLEAFPDGGHWVGKNYTFDRRFAHGATTKEPEVVGKCCVCTTPWDRYQAHKKCSLCRMEVLVCKECEKSGKWKTVKMKCHLCGGPKPSYLPPEDKTLKFKKKTNKFQKRAETDF